jgi:hypothetical protein
MEFSAAFDSHLADGQQIAHFSHKCLSTDAAVQIEVQKPQDMSEARGCGGPVHRLAISLSSGWHKAPYGLAEFEDTTNYHDVCKAP